MGTGETSVGKYIAECQRVLEKSGLQYEVSLRPGDFSDCLRHEVDFGFINFRLLRCSM